MPAVAFLSLLLLGTAAALPGPVKVGVFPAAPLVIPGEGRPQGLFVELLEEIAKREGWELSFVPGTWNELLKELRSGDIDVLPAVGMTREREGVYDFSTIPVYIDSGAVYTRRDSLPRTVYDLRGRKIAAVRGSVFTSGFTDYLAAFGVSCELLLTDNNEQVMEAILDRTVDAGVSIYSLGADLMRRYPVSVSAISFSPLALGFAVPKGRDGDILAGINEVMASLVGDDESAYYRIVRKWTKPTPPARLPGWLLWSLAAALGLGLALSAWSLALRRQVAAKTRYLSAEISERVEAEARLKRSLEEKNVLIRELYHRTRNTIQVILGLVSMKASEFPGNTELQGVVEDSSQRIQAIALAHQALYSSRDLSRLEIRTYIKDLVQSLAKEFEVGGGKVSFVLDILDGLFPLDLAIPLGLVLNELLSNAFKHAFPEGRGGKVTITLRRLSAGTVELLFADDGVGLPEGFDIAKSAGLGLRLVTEIGERQLMGRLSITSGTGTAFRLEMPDSFYEPRI
jgi:two-component sensor histidine kinase